MNFLKSNELCDVPNNVVNNPLVYATFCLQKERYPGYG